MNFIFHFLHLLPSEPGFPYSLARPTIHQEQQHLDLLHGFLSKMSDAHIQKDLYLIPLSSEEKY